MELTIISSISLPVQLDLPPDQKPVSKQVCEASPETTYPVLQEKLATELYVVVENKTIPFLGSSTGPQSMTTVV